MSRDGLLPRIFSDVHPKWQTPWRSNLLFMLFTSSFSAFAPISVVGHMTSIGTLLAFVIVCAGIMIMRRTQPDLPRPFKTPLVPWVPIGGILVCAAMMYSLGPDNWFRLIAWLVIGQIIFFSYGRGHSKLRPASERGRFTLFDRLMAFGNAGFLAGGIMGFLLRPLAPTGAKLAFSTVIARGATLPDAALVETAKVSFNTMMLGVVIGVAAGVAAGWLVYALRDRPAGVGRARPLQ